MNINDLIEKLQKIRDINSNVNIHVQTCCELQLLKDVVFHNNDENNIILISTEVCILNGKERIH